MRPHTTSTSTRQSTRPIFAAIRILFYVATLVSLILLVTTAALWIRSYFVCDYLAHSAGTRTHPTRLGTVLIIRSNAGGIQVLVMHWDEISSLHNVVTPAPFGWQYLTLPVQTRQPNLAPETRRYASGLGFTFE